MIKKGLKVKVLTGKDKNKEGEVIEINRQSNRAKVKELNMVKKHIKTTKEKKGGIVSKENFIALHLGGDSWDYPFLVMLKKKFNNKLPYVFHLKKTDIEKKLN